jgi:hydrogen peroxide-dependent heme synthase
MSDTVFALYPVFLAADEFRELGEEDVGGFAQELENLVKSWEGVVEVRGSYSTVGFRADADLLLWLVGRSAEDVQRFLVEFRRTDAGRLLDLSWSFMGMVRPAEFTPDHQPAFLKGEGPRTYLCVYPFVRSQEWYLLPREKRAELLAEHGVMGREFPEVLANTTSAFGLGDWEWILAFETDQLDRLVDCIRRLRDAEARRFTKEEVPFITGIRKDIRGCLNDLR